MYPDFLDGRVPYLLLDRLVIESVREVGALLLKVVEPRQALPQFLACGVSIRTIRPVLKIEQLEGSMEGGVTPAARR